MKIFTHEVCKDGKEATKVLLSHNHVLYKYFKLVFSCQIELFWKFFSFKHILFHKFTFQHKDIDIQ